MKKLIAIALFSAATVAARAQEQPQDGPVVKSTLAQMLRVQATISPAWSVTLLRNGDSIQSVGGGRTNVYAHGTAEYYWDERFSTRGDLYFLLNKSADPGGVKMNHGFQVGVSCHLLKRSMIDPFIGLRTGLNVTQTQPATEAYPISPTVTAMVNYNPPVHIDPTWAPVVGINFYGERVFHFFIEGAYMMGMYRPNIGPQFSLEEFRVSAGLGFNFSFYKPVETVRQKI